MDFKKISTNILFFCLFCGCTTLDSKLNPTNFQDDTVKLIKLGKISPAQAQVMLLNFKSKNRTFNNITYYQFLDESEKIAMNLNLEKIEKVNQITNNLNQINSEITSNDLKITELDYFLKNKGQNALWSAIETDNKIEALNQKIKIDTNSINRINETYGLKMKVYDTPSPFKESFYSRAKKHNKQLELDLEVLKSKNEYLSTSVAENKKLLEKILEFDEFNEKYYNNYKNLSIEIEMAKFDSFLDDREKYVSNKRKSNLAILTTADEAVNLSYLIDLNNNKKYQILYKNFESNNNLIKLINSPNMFENSLFIGNLVVKDLFLLKDNKISILYQINKDLCIQQNISLSNNKYFVENEYRFSCKYLGQSK